VNVFKSWPKSKLNIFEYYPISITKDKMEWENDDMQCDEGKSEESNRRSRVIMFFYNYCIIAFIIIYYNKNKLTLIGDSNRCLIYRNSPLL